MGNWFLKIKREFAKLAMPYAGKPITYVEVGVWGGDSAEWVTQNILTHPESAGWGFDPYLPDPKHTQREVNAIYEGAYARLKGTRFKLCRLPSIKAFKVLDYPFVRGIDLLYLDGAHDAASVVQDFCGAWPHINIGATVMFDDYGIGKRKSIRHVPAAVDAIEAAFGDMVTVSRGEKQASCYVHSKEAPIEASMKKYAEKSK
jgi:hypothetical protein